MFYEQTQSRTDSERSELNSAQKRAPAAKAAEVKKAQESINQTLHTLLRTKKEKERQYNQQNEYEDATEEEEDASGLESDCRASRQNVTEVLNDDIVKPRLHNQYLNIENLRAE